MIIKVCGITTLETALAAQQAGADLIGFVFTHSRRRIGVAAARDISQQLQGVAKVGVFVDQPVQEVREVADHCGLDYIQLHGNESPDYCAQLHRPVIKAIRVNQQFNPEEVRAFQTAWLLLDSYSPGQPGGTGTSFDWPYYRAAVSQLKRPFLVAGGLQPSNVAEAIAILSPHGVDVSGGVETDGVKDPEKIGQFIVAARAAGREKEYA